MCAAEKWRLRPTSRDGLHHTPRMHNVLVSTRRPQHSVPQRNRLPIPSARHAVFWLPPVTVWSYRTIPSARHAVLAGISEGAEPPYVPR